MIKGKIKGNKYSCPFFPKRMQIGSTPRIDTMFAKLRNTMFRIGSCIDNLGVDFHIALLCGGVACGTGGCWLSVRLKHKEVIR